MKTKTLFETLGTASKKASAKLVKPLQKLYFEDVYRPVSIASFNWMEAKTDKLLDVALSNLEEKMVGRGVDPVDAKLLAVAFRGTVLFISKAAPLVIKATKEVIYAGEAYLDDTADYRSTADAVAGN